MGVNARFAEREGFRQWGACPEKPQKERVGK